MAGSSCPIFEAAVAINEIRTDQIGTDTNEFFELAGTPGAALGDLSYLVIGDGTGGSGVIEFVLDLDGFVVPADGYFLVVEDTFTLGGGLASADIVLTGDGLNFENSDNVTHLLVRGFHGQLFQDIDLDNDGVLDSPPWSAVVDSVAILAEEFPPSQSECTYSQVEVGPDGGNAPGMVYRCSNGTGIWRVGANSPIGLEDTPGSANPCIAINELRTDQPGTDNDEYVELAGAAGASLDDMTYVVIGDGASPATGSGVIEAVIQLSGHVLPSNGLFLIVENTFSLGGGLSEADLVVAGDGLNFENSDNVTHLLVRGFFGFVGQDLDTNDDCALDITPWNLIDDQVSILQEANPPGTSECVYSTNTVGPANGSAPGLAIRCAGRIPEWRSGAFSPGSAEDTPGQPNACPLLTGACCQTGGCTVELPDACTTLGGTYCGDGTSCQFDSDGDGILDGSDGCPQDSNKSEPGLCGCGVADSDMDGDGIVGCLDPCPIDPLNDADHDGLCADADPCPLDLFNDSDGDGICNSADRCAGQDDTIDLDGNGIPDCNQIPTVSSWGLIIMGLLLMTAYRVRMGMNPLDPVQSPRPD